MTLKEDIAKAVEPILDNEIGFLSVNGVYLFAQEIAEAILQLPYFQDVQRLVEAARRVTDGNYFPDGVTKHTKCPHGQYGYEGCEDCCRNDPCPLTLHRRKPMNLKEQFKRFAELDAKRTRETFFKEERPWVALGPAIYATPDGPSGVADCLHGAYPLSQAESNAAFIASAPAMFKCLQTAMQVIERQRKALIAVQDAANVIDANSKATKALAFTEQFMGDDE